MPRPLGSKNKVKNKNGLQVLMFDKDIAGAPLTKVNQAYNIVNWGSKNDYPNKLLDLYNQSPTHHAAIQFGCQAILGGGIDADAMKLDGSQIMANYRQSWEEVLRALSLDYLLYGSYALEIIKNRDNKTYSFYHVPLDKVRWTEYDEDGQILKYAISADWTSPSKYAPVYIDAYDTIDNNRLAMGKAYLYVYRTYSPTQTYYTSPAYASAIKAIQSEAEFVNYDLRAAANSFVPSGMLVLNEVETEEQRQAIIRSITNMFQGSDNANSIMISFKANPEDPSPEFVPFQASSENVNLFESANQRTVSRILAGHGIPNASLIGIPDISNSGFASEADKLEVGFKLYMSLVGNSNRQAVVSTVNQMLALNGIETEIVLKPLYFLGEQVDSPSVDSVDVEEDVTSDNIEEQEIGN